jgi:hypothetical protein
MRKVGIGPAEWRFQVSRDGGSHSMAVLDGLAFEACVDDPPMSMVVKSRFR